MGPASRAVRQESRRLSRVLETTERQQEEPDTEYTLTWRNKFLATGAKSIAEMATALEGAARELRELERAGVTLAPDGGVEDDYATLVTTDPRVAEKYGFDEEDEEFDDFNEADVDPDILAGPCQ